MVTRDLVRRAYLAGAEEYQGSMGLPDPEDVEKAVTELIEQDVEEVGDAIHAAVHPGHPWSGCSNPDLVYTWVGRFQRALATDG